MGAFGVDLFFVLSSFLITELLLREKSLLGEVDVRSFYIRRVLRIWPLYFAFLFLAAAMQWFVPGQHIGWRAAVGFSFLAGNWWIVFHGFPSSVIFPLWSVSIEEQFYLLWPAAVKRAGTVMMLGLAVFLLALANVTASLSWAAPRVGDPGVVQYAGATRPDCRRHSDRGVIEGKGSDARRQGKGLAGNGRNCAVVGGRQFLPHQGRSAQVAGPAAGLPGNGGGCFSAADRRALRPADAGEEFPGVPGPHFVWALCFSCFGADVFGLSDAEFYRVCRTAGAARAACTDADGRAGGGFLSLAGDSIPEVETAIYARAIAGRLMDFHGELLRAR